MSGDPEKWVAEAIAEQEAHIANSRIALTVDGDITADGVVVGHVTDEQAKQIRAVSMMDLSVQPETLRCPKCTGLLAEATGVCTVCGADPLGYYCDELDHAKCEHTK